MKMINETKVKCFVFVNVQKQMSKCKEKQIDFECKLTQLNCN